MSLLRHLLLFFFTHLLIFAVHARRCISPRPVTPAFCQSPPVVRRFDAAAYAGRWFQLFTSGAATRFSPSTCVTANYTLRADASLAVSNCQFPAGVSRPLCLSGVASRAPGGKPAQLQVRFTPTRPAGPYNVAALLGHANYGYFAAAVYSCRLGLTGFDEGFFIIARTPFMPKLVLRKLKKKLRCSGYKIDARFEPTQNGKDCVYFDGPMGFDADDRFTGPPSR